MHYEFESIIKKQKVYFTCTCCNKPNRTRTIKVEQTVNPYNRNVNGEIKTRDEIVESVKEKLRLKVEEFNRKPICTSCE